MQRFDETQVFVVVTSFLSDKPSVTKTTLLAEKNEFTFRNFVETLKQQTKLKKASFVVSCTQAAGRAPVVSQFVVIFFPDGNFVYQIQETVSKIAFNKMSHVRYFLLSNS